MPEGTFGIFALQSIYIPSREKGHINVEQSFDFHFIVAWIVWYST